MKLRYSMLIQWSNEDGAYLVFLPEFQGGPITHGKTYKKAAKAGGEVLKLLIGHYKDEGRPLPQPDVYVAESEPGP